MMSSPQQGPRSPEEREELRKNVAQLIRSILMPSKDGVELDKLQQEYIDFNAKPIPFRKIGYASLEDFLIDSGDFCKISRNSSGKLLVKVVESEDTAHIRRLVAKQKSNKKRPARPMHAPMQRLPAPGFRSWQSSSLHQHRGQHHLQQQSRRLGAMHQLSPIRHSPPNKMNQTHGGRMRPVNNLVRQQRVPVVVQGSSKAAPQQQRQSSGPHGTNKQAPVKRNSKSSQTSAADGAKVTQELRQLCADCGFVAPRFKTSQMTNKRFVSVVVVAEGPEAKNERRFQTFPADYPSSEMAEAAAAKLAMEKLKKETSHHASSEGDDVGALGAEMEFLCDRVARLVGDRQNGLWSSYIEVKYKEQFGPLPGNWIDVVRNSAAKKLKVEKTNVDGRFILTPCLDEQSQENPGAIRQNNEVSQNLVSGEAKAMNGKHEPEAVKQNQQLPDIEFPKDEGGFWNVYVTYVYSSSCVFIRFLGEQHSVKYENLLTEMAMYYFNEEEFPSLTNPELNHLYVVKFEDEWHRVEVVDISGEFIVVFFVDHGEKELVTKEHLKEIDPRFLQLPKQAFPVKLHGLEQFADRAYALQEIQNSLTGKVLVAEIRSRNGQDISIVLHDTSSDPDVNLNNWLLDRLQIPPLELPNLSLSPSSSVSSDSPTMRQQLTDANENGLVDISEPLLSSELASLKELMPPKVPPIDSFFDVNVIMAASPSNFTVQPWEALDELDKMQYEMSMFYRGENNRPVTKEDLQKDCYFACRHSDGFWYRARVNSQLDDYTVAVRFVDFGDFCMIALEDMRILWAQFRNLPMQAINASLANIVPVSTDWTAPDTVWFSNRVMEKQFVSVIKDICTSGGSEGTGMCLKLSLIDTTHPTVDVDVEQELVDSKKAVFLCV